MENDGEMLHMSWAQPAQTAQTYLGISHTSYMLQVRYWFSNHVHVGAWWIEITIRNSGAEPSFQRKFGCFRGPTMWVLHFASCYQRDCWVYANVRATHTRSI